MAKTLYATILLLFVTACDIGGSGTGQSLAVASRVDATIQDALSSRTNKPGDTLRAVVSHDVIDSRGSVVIPSGSNVTLTIEQLESGSNAVRPEGRIALVVNSVSVNGREQPLNAALEPVQQHMEGARDVVVSAGTPIVFTLTHTLNISTR
jgi:hypothetical protein